MSSKGVRIMPEKVDWKRYKRCYRCEQLVDLKSQHYAGKLTCSSGGGIEVHLHRSCATEHGVDPNQNVFPFYLGDKGDENDYPNPEGAPMFS
jgi:hypothetical protein